MTVRALLLLAFTLLAGCAALTGREPEPARDADAQIRPQSRPTTVAPPATARTETEFDTTTAEEQAAAQEVPEDGTERVLGTTIASLGSPSEPGFWLKTPLVRQEGRGRVVYPPTGKSVQVTLIPIEGPPTAGSRMSLPALRLLDAPLTGLAEVQVFAGG